MNLKGAYFFTFEKNEETGKREIDKQGLVLKDDSNGSGYLTCQLFSWLTGSPTSVVVYHISRLADGKAEFYEHHADWLARADKENQRAR